MNSQYNDIRHSTTNKPLKVAWIGLGTMGAPMAGRLAASGVAVGGVDLSDRARRDAASRGVAMVDNMADAVAEADVVLTILPAAQHVRGVMDGADGILAHAAPGTLIIDASTVDVETSRWCHEQSIVHGHRFVDAPVSGGASGAEDGTLTVMFGGEPKAVAQAEQIFEPMVKSAIVAGGPTSGVAAKICNNMMLFINLVSASEGSQLAQHLGLDPKVFWKIASEASGRSFPLETWYPYPGVVGSSPANRNFAPDFPVTGALKDVKLALAAGDETGVKLSAANLVAKQLNALIDQGLGDKDCSLIVKLAAPDGTVTGFSQ